MPLIKLHQIDFSGSASYTGSGSTSRRCYYKRQFWLEDIEVIDAQTQSNIPDQGIFPGFIMLHDR